MRSFTRVPKWQVNETRGKPIAAFGRQVTPIGRVVQARWLGLRFTRHRPVAVEVREGESVRRMPVRNLTENIRSIVFLAGVGIGILISLWMRWGQLRRREKS